MRSVRKARREWFGAVIYTEHPSLTAFVGHRYADALGVAPAPLALKPGIYSAPLDVHLAITTRCDMHCAGCYATGSNTPAEDMPRERWQPIIRHLSQLGVLTISLGGGEPLLHPDVFDLAHVMRERHVMPNMTSNGRGITAEIAERCRVFGSVHLSYHTRDDRPILERAARHLIAKGVRPGLNLLMTRRTFAELPQVLGWARRQQFERVLMLRFKPVGAAQGVRHLVLTPAEVQQFYPTLKRALRRHPVTPLLDCSFFPAVALHHPNRRKLAFFDVSGCHGGNKYLAVDVQGRYRPCSFWPDPFGDVESLDLETWRDDPDLNAFRRPASAGRCRKCRYQELCNSGCPLLEAAGCA